jgi:hypothetical protein
MYTYCILPIAISNLTISVTLTTIFSYVQRKNPKTTDTDQKVVHPLNARPRCYAGFAPENSKKKHTLILNATVKQFLTIKN